VLQLDDPSGAFVPVSHAVHSVAPSLAEYVNGGQRSHEADARPLATDPALHGTHPTVPPTSALYSPGWHGVHRSTPSVSLNVPGAHGSQPVSAMLGCWPTGQVVAQSAAQCSSV
jgi:hypothetical protein